MKKYILSLIITIALLMGSITALVIVVDPFYHFHAPSDTNNIYIYNEMYQSPGMARNFEYDSIMLGTSMTENFRPSMFKEYDENALVVSYAGGRSKDIAKLVDQAFKSSNDIKKIYIDLNDYQLCSAPDSEFSDLPDYLYDSNPLNDVQYIFNIDVISECINRITTSNENNVETAFTWDDPELFGKNKVMQDYYSSHANQAWVNTEGYDSALVKDTAVKNVQNFESYITAHPDTEFIFFLPPYSAAYWYDLKEQNKLDEKLDMYQAAIEELLKYKNAKIFFFMDDYETICNLDSYRDLCHYHPLINEKMTKDIHSEAFRITSADLSERIEKLKEFVKNYILE